MGKLTTIVTSGTGIEKASKSFLNKNISDVISTSYTEMLMSKSGNTKYFSEEYLDELDPVKNKRLYDFIKSSLKQKEILRKTLGYIPDVNLFKLVLPKSPRDLIHC